MDKPKKNNEIQRIIKATQYSLEGLRATFASEAAFRTEVFLSVLLVPLALWLTDDNLSRALLIGSWLLVLLVEVINSAIEAVVDRIGPEIHPLSKKAKDAGSAAVFLALLNAALIWFFVAI